MRTTLKTTALFFFTGLMWGQNPADNSTLKTTVMTLESTINAAIDGGDLVRAMRVAATLNQAINSGYHAGMPSATQLLQQLETKYASARPGHDAFLALRNLPGAAFDAGDMTKAEQYASTLLFEASKRKDDPFYPDAVFEGSSMLGRMMLRRGNTASAVQLLSTSLSGGSSPQQQYVGLNMGLAQELLAKGERDAVLQFLTACKAVWTNDNGKLDLWSAAIRGGGTPTLNGWPIN